MLESIRAHVFAVLAAILATTVSAGEQVAQGDIAPNWILADVHGQEASLYEEAEQGKWTVMVFCASWCSNCKELLPKMEKLSKLRAKAPVAFYLMNVWEDKDPALLAQEQSYQLPVVRQAEHVAKRYGIRITPGVVVVGPDKRIHYLRQTIEDTTTVADKVQKTLELDLPSSE